MLPERVGIRAERSWFNKKCCGAAVCIMTQEQIMQAKLLDGCTYLPGSFEKRFARNMAALAETNPEKELTAKQADWLEKQFFRYRNQIGKADKQVKELLKDLKPPFELAQGKLF